MMEDGYCPVCGRAEGAGHEDPCTMRLGVHRTVVEFEVHCGEECVAITCGENAEDDAWHYARIYSQDGETKVYRVTKTYEPIG